jgi:hypothetical protein
MKTITAQARHRAHHTRHALLAMVFALGCGPSIPRPQETAVSSSDYVPVTFPPRPPPVEFIPPAPDPHAVWVDGSWEWSGDRYGWIAGRWVIPPAGARHARWTLVRRAEDGQLFFAPSSWRTADGQPIDDRTFSRALGGRARARATPSAGATPKDETKDDGRPD